MALASRKKTTPSKTPSKTKTVASKAMSSASVAAAIDSVASPLQVADPFPFPVPEAAPPFLETTPSVDLGPEDAPPVKEPAMMHSGFLINAGSQWFARIPGRVSLAPVEVLQWTSRLVHLRDLDNEHITGAYGLDEVVFVDVI